MNATDFRKELVKILPGYIWTIHKTKACGYLRATGTQSSGFNRLSTLSVTRREHDGEIWYEVKSAGYGRRAEWLHANEDRTLARAMRGLQEHYEATAAVYRAHANAIKLGRVGVSDQSHEPLLSGCEAVCEKGLGSGTCQPS